MSDRSQAFVILGNHLFPKKFLGQNKSDSYFFMAEDTGLCTHYKYHKHKIIFFLASMRTYAQELEGLGYDLTYRELESERESESFEDKFRSFASEKKLSKVITFEIEDKFFERRLKSLFQELDLELEVRTSPMFLFERQSFRDYNSAAKKPFMKNFYEERRKSSGVLMSKNAKPKGGKFSFDSENRKKLPKDLDVPELQLPKNSEITEKVVKLVDDRFSNHPGDAHNFWLPVSREEALDQLDQFVEKRLKLFGDYQDAISTETEFNFHSVLSPYLNIGLITPDEVIEKVVAKRSVEMNSTEGFVRQLLGWREFVRGIYQEYSETQDRENFFKHEGKMTKHWYRGDTGIPPLDDAIKKSLKRAYCHHIERLMILSNFMLLCRLDPQEVHRWFMELFVDSSDWVMGPNVYGMGQFSDGGIFATKPYISGSNYILKMSDYKKAEWCEVHDGLFWSFLKDNEEFFRKNHRMGMLLRTLEKMDSKKKSRIFEKALNFRKRVTA